MRIAGELTVRGRADRDAVQAMAATMASRGPGDTEVILKAFAEWGTAGVERLGGMFAFALYDHAARRLVLARDRSGSSPCTWPTSRGRCASPPRSRAELLLEPWLSGQIGLVNAFGPGVGDDKRVHGHLEDFIRFYLRVFAFCGHEVGLMTGGLTRVALDPGALVVNSSQNGGGKDTWVIDEALM